jgi:general secretion pathway protein G
MGVNTVSGEKQFSVFGFQFSEERKTDALRDFQGRRVLLRTENRKLKTGFTLLELMIVISIIVILAVIAMPQYQKTIVHARETVLRDNLYQLRKAIDLYAADKGKLPQSLEELATAGYIRELPIDPITGEKDWTVETGEDPSSLTSESGITTVHSASPDTSTDGTPYSEW